MEQGAIHPSILMKIQAQPYQFNRNFYIPQVSTPKGQSGAFVNVKGILHSLHPAHDQGSDSSSILPMSQVVEAPSEKGNDFLYKIKKGLAIRMTTAPFERVKVLIQCQNDIIKKGRLSNFYKGIIDCFFRTVRNEGVISLWRGNTARMLEFLSKEALNTAAEYYLERLLKHKQGKDDFLKRFARDVVTIGFRIGASHYLFYPLKYAHIRLATDMINNTSGKVNERQFNGLIDVWRRTIKTDGIVGLYRGSNISYVNTLLQHAFSLPMLMLLDFFGFQFDSSWNFGVAAFGTATCVWVVTYPLDTVHHRMVMRSEEAIKYKSSFDAFSQILMTEGVKSLYKGATALLLKNIIILDLLLSPVNLFKAKELERKSKSGDPGSSSISITWKKG